MLLVLLLCLALVPVRASATDCHTGSDVAVTLISPSASGTYPTPVNFQATASSSQTITGYVVYTNASGSNTGVYQNNGQSTLDAWVILPLTSSGGAQTQNVFVRAWNSGGYCGDSPVLTVTASGAYVPAPLAQTQVFSNADDDQSGDGGVTHGWGDCGNCAGGSPSTVSFSFGQNPTLDGNGSFRLNVSGGNYVDGLFWYKVGAQDSDTNFLWDFWFQVGGNTAAQGQALEFDLFQVVGGQEYMFGTQCNYSSGTWQAWNAASGQWIDAIPNTATDQSPTGTPISCSKFAPGTWHHLQYFLQRTYGGRILYGNVTVDGITTQWNISAPPNSTTWSDVLGIQHQLDTNNSFSGTTTLSEWVEEESLFAWPQQ
jgi:hypothetical protein